MTAWKAIHHPLLWLFMGKVWGQCTVRIRPLDARRTRIVFQGDLASHRDIKGNPMLGAARHAYASAARQWQREVRQELMKERSARHR